MNRKHALVGLSAALAVVVSATALAAKPEDAIKYRRGVMAAQGWNMGNLAAMVKGEKPFDKAEFAQRAANIAALSKMAPEGFAVPGSDQGDTKTKPEAFTDEKFKGGLEKLGAETAKLAQVAAGGDLAAIKPQFGEVAKLCKGCHDNFRKQ